MRKGGAITLLLFLWLLSACGSRTVVHHYESIASKGWERSDTLSFTIPPIPHNGTYTIDLGLRYTNTFPYEAVWLVAETRLLHPRSFHRDTLRFVLADSLGIPTGNGIGLLQREVELTSLPLNKGQEGCIRIHHIMARETLPFITDVGLKVMEN